MKIKKSQLRKIIKEAIERESLHEFLPGFGDADDGLAKLGGDLFDAGAEIALGPTADVALDQIPGGAILKKLLPTSSKDRVKVVKIMAKKLATPGSMRILATGNKGQKAKLIAKTYAQAMEQAGQYDWLSRKLKKPVDRKLAEMAAYQLLQRVPSL